MRDFSKVGIEFELSADIQQSESLAKALINELDAILEQRPDLFAHLLYIMDLSETKVKEIIQTSDYTARDLALPMIHRAAEKVYWRKRYSTH